jgi:2-(1,2-epoxy-1,2-dihydrophenyl)acetyl-CoA isomerase
MALRLYDLGVVNRIVPKDTSFQTALLWAATLAKGPRVAQGWIKKLAYEAQNNSLSNQLDAERDALIENMYAPECEEGLKAFQGKRDPNFLTVN